MSHKRLNNYSVTLNYKEEKTWIDFVSTLPEWVEYCVYGFEVAPTTGQEHLQCFVQSYKTMIQLTRKKMRKLLHGAHIELCYKPAEVNEKYCKKDKNFHIVGEYNECGRGARNDLKDMMEDIKNGASEELIMSTYPANYLRYRNHVLALINKAHSAKNPVRRAAARQVILITGPSGSGKTRGVFDAIGDKPFYRVANQDNTMWWPGYEGQDIVVLDDYKGGMKLNTLLGILDPWYNTDVSSRPGTLVRMSASTIYITSTQSPQQWYPGQDISELERRISELRPSITEAHFPQIST